MAFDEAWLTQQLQKPGYGLVDEPADAARPSLPPLDTSEGRLLAAIRRLALQYGWLCYHTYRATKSEPGFPDLVLTDGTSLLMIELKSPTGKVTAEQAQWLDLLTHTGKVEADVWRPQDWPYIEARLTRRNP